MDNTNRAAELIALARDSSTQRDLPYIVAVARDLADRLEAAEAELTAAHAAIAESPAKAGRIASLVRSATRLVQIERDDARAALVRAEAELTRRDAALTPHVVDVIAEAGKRIDLGRRKVALYSRDERLIYELVLALSAAAAPVSLEAVKAETNIQEEWLPVEVTEWRPVETEGDNRV